MLLVLLSTLEEDISPLGQTIGVAGIYADIF